MRLSISLIFALAIISPSFRYSSARAQIPDDSLNLDNRPSTSVAPYVGFPTNKPSKDDESAGDQEYDSGNDDEIPVVPRLVKRKSGKSKGQKCNKPKGKKGWKSGKDCRDGINSGFEKNNTAPVLFADTVVAMGLIGVGAAAANLLV
ncbi:hypothetical protein EX30DRAFT_146068 [Ascodesmis nigricans]|uniref:Uncharacterized protein n=1 Tax=Ascodesmis nigricans TaxID=341454 RepID=A0A4S2N1I8_9PEZI|nr:hypothetical protein EX30DRAFT_146068 [Ascodesmis nigricans]